MENKATRRNLPSKIRRVLGEVKKNIREAYGEDLKGIILYGSYARGEEVAGSDLDLIILLKKLSNSSEEILRCSSALGDLELENDIVISILPIAEKDFKSRNLPVILNARREGIRI